MKQATGDNLYLREQLRVEIAQQVEEFIRQGGAIQQVGRREGTNKAIGTAWEESAFPESDQ